MVYQFCLNDTDCRRTLILNHFTEKFDPAFCEGTCDNCASTDEVTDVDLTTHAIQYVNMFKELETKHMKITGPQSTNAFRGTQKNEMARKSFDTLDNFAKGSDLSVDLVKRLFDHLIIREILTTGIEDTQDPNRPPICYVYVLAFFFTLVMLRLTSSLQLGPKAKEFLNKPKPSFVLKIRTARRGIRAARSKKGLQPPALASTVSTTRKKRARLDTVNDPVEPFSPDTYEADFDDIEPEPQELPTASLPLVQASDPHEECYRELCALRAKVWALYCTSAAFYVLISYRS